MARLKNNSLLLNFWPWSVSSGVLGLTLSGMGFYYMGLSWGVVFLFMYSSCVFILSMLYWWGDTVLKSSYGGWYDGLVTRNLLMFFGFLVLAEFLFFIGFLWAFVIPLSGELLFNDAFFWGPKDVKIMSTWKVPSVNSMVLLMSSVTVSWCHKELEMFNMNLGKSAGNSAYSTWRGTVHTGVMKNNLMTNCPMCTKNSFYYMEYPKVEKFTKSTCSLAIDKSVSRYILHSIGPEPSVLVAITPKDFILEHRKRPSSLKSISLKLVCHSCGMNSYVLKNSRGSLCYLMGNNKLWGGHRYQILFSLGCSILLGLYFLYSQCSEYYPAFLSSGFPFPGSRFYACVIVHGVYLLMEIMFMSIFWLTIFFFPVNFRVKWFDVLAYFWYVSDVSWSLLYGISFMWSIFS